MVEVDDCVDDVGVLVVVESEDEDDNDSVVDNDCDVIAVDDAVEVVERVVVNVPLHPLALTQSHGDEQMVKQF